MTTNDPKSRVPEPALFRGAIVAVLSVIGVILGKELDTTWVDYVLNVYTAVIPIVLALWIRQHVKPAKGSGE